MTSGKPSVVANIIFQSKNPYEFELKTDSTLLTLKGVTLPQEIVNIIAGYADVPSVVQLSQCNKMLYKEFGHEDYWRVYLERYFGCKPETDFTYKKFAIVLHRQMSLYLDGLKSQVLEKQIVASQEITDVRFTLPRPFIYFFADQISRLCPYDVRGKSLTDKLLPLDWIYDGYENEYARGLRFESRTDQRYQNLVDEWELDPDDFEVRYSFVTSILQNDSSVLGEPIIWFGNTGAEESPEYAGFLVDFSTLVPNAQSDILSIDLQEAMVVVAGYNAPECCPFIHIAHNSFITFVSFSGAFWGSSCYFFDRHGLCIPEHDIENEDEECYPYSDFLKQYLQRRKQFSPQTVTEEEENGEKEEYEQEHIQPLKKQRRK